MTRIPMMAVFFLPAIALATSYAPSAAQKALPAEDHCEVESRYLGEHVPEDIVFWRFSGGTAKAAGNISCDAVTKEFAIRIFGARKSQRIGKVIYPEYIPSPQPDASYHLMLVKRERVERGSGRKVAEWTVLNWREGFRKVEP